MSKFNIKGTGYVDVIIDRWENLTGKKAVLIRNINGKETDMEKENKGRLH